MKVMIVGAGAVGCYYGARLANAGNEVFFIARGKNLATIKSDGITIKSFDGDFRVTPPCDSDGSPFGLVDLVIVCVKAYDTKGALDLYCHNVNENSVILSLQNGVDNEEIIASRYGKEKVIGGAAFIGARMESPGEVLHTAFGHITIGEFAAQNSDRTDAIASLFQEAGVSCKVSSDIKRVLYTKMIWNIGYNAICAILDAPAGEVVKNSTTQKTIRAAMEEWIAVAQAAGVSLSDEMVEKKYRGDPKGRRGYSVDAP